MYHQPLQQITHYDIIEYMKKTITTIVIVLLVGIIIYLLVRSPSKQVPAEEKPVTAVDTHIVASSTVQATTTPSVVDTNGKASSIGMSVEGHPINAYHFGTGSKELLFVGGIHGGYAWNTALVAYQMIDYLKANPSAIPANLTITVIPVLNPDGLKKVVGTTTGNFSKKDVSTSQAMVTLGRFNSDDVDLNRNFDCDWQSIGKWQSTTVSGGTAVFSEPESISIKNYIVANKPAAVVAWYSAGGGVYASNCHKGVSTETSAITKAYAAASGYTANDSFDFYATTGDMTNWLAKINIPAIGVLLTNHTDTEWVKNQAGILALLKYYTK